MLLIGLGLLNYGSDWFILGNTRIARYFKISNFVIGATIVAFGTSLPEVVTTLYALYRNLPMIALGNALGSCIVNIGFVLGLCAIIYPIVIKQESIIRNIYLYLLYSLLLFILGYDGFNVIDGVVLFLLFLCYVAYTLKRREFIGEEKRGKKDIPMVLAVILIIIGLLSIFVGSKLFIDGARDIALFLGVPEKVIGFTLVAFGTSLPEIAVSLSAIRRRLGDIVLGNVIGSNMVNVGCALALSSIITYIPPTRFELLIHLLFTVLMVIIISKMKLLNKGCFKIERIDGLILFGVYLLYVLNYFL
ncbi:calcium/sodium antiporter [Methanothermococcus sp. SCGC AD-155-E23]|nr:calcium/sodium antiporter [Methanothermococcus sp. SCGC AD-155-E23]